MFARVTKVVNLERGRAILASASGVPQGECRGPVQYANLDPRMVEVMLIVIHRDASPPWATEMLKAKCKEEARVKR